jgi:hypothetical protein
VFAKRTFLPRLRRLRWRILAVAGAILVWASLYADCWHVVSPYWFGKHFLDTEYLVLGRCNLARQHGCLFADGGLAGSVTGIYPRYEAQYDCFFNASVIDSAASRYSPYMSQSCFQTVLISLVDRILPLAPHQRFALYRAATALLATLSFMLLVYWIHRKFGAVAAVLAFGSVISSPFITVFGRNLWFQSWTYLLPFFAVAWRIKRMRPNAPVSFRTDFLVVGAAVLVKCMLNGYEYVTTAVLAILSPYVYDWCLRQRGLKHIAAQAGSALGGAACAIAITCAILVGQISAVKGSPEAGINYLLQTAEERMYGNPEKHVESISASLHASTASVVSLYLRGRMFEYGLINWERGEVVPWRWLRSSVRFAHLIILTVLASCVLLWSARRCGSERRRIIAAVASTGISIAAPLSWIVLFKAHAFVHPHLDTIVWYVPFVPMAAGLCGLAISRWYAVLLGKSDCGPA